MRTLISILLSISLFIICEQPITLEASPNDGNVSDLYDDQESENDSTNLVNNQNEESSDTAFQSDRSLFLDFLKMVLALIVVLALIYFLLKFIQKRNKLYQQSRSLENLGGLSLGSNKSVQIIRVGQHYYLIGVGEDIQLLSEIKDEETIDHLLNQNNQQGTTFQDVLKSFQKKPTNPYQQDDTKQQFNHQLQSMKQTRERLLKRYKDRNEGPPNG
ncbi:flagellar biosynthetic protein FliO [Piscibacillus halophilus]|uniref:Flagellar protein FliO/FliZ n=1 Tax=Piscibacillus halophilus TaxID=571933 RepID=A0A1H8Z1B6_9BACI|nr:flagellar biosynthetic protein FliO [Piscibacillus halophilus]SEP57418.1 flagellar protein FliO/FliZ [Piscibacillus halophilus]